LQSVLERDILEGCGPFGDIEKVTVFEANPQGIVLVKFATAASAMACQQTMQGRYFAGRTVNATFWDGETNYALSVSDAVVASKEKEEEKRLEEFGEWLDGQDDLPEELRLRTE
jgi:hypothetical protein